MARRKRKKSNPLLIRILVFSAIAHAIALPIAAHFGAFDKLKQEFGTSKVVMVNVANVEEPKKKAPTPPKKENRSTNDHKAKANASHATTRQSSNLPQPKVVTGAPDTGAGNGGPTADANGSGVAGALPTGPKTTAPTTPPPTNPNPPTDTTTKPPPLPPKTGEVKPTPPPEPPQPPAPPQPKPRRIVEAEAAFSPQPEIPDDLRTEPLDKTLVVEADVDTGGHPVNVKVAESTGIRELDDVGLDTAKRYRFKPATVDDSPVQEHVRFRIIFKVE